MLIGELARRSGVSARMLRHYDRIGLVSPTERSSADYRQYTPADVDRLLQVEGLRSLGLSLAEVAHTLDASANSTTDLVERLVERAHAQLASTTELLSRLERVRSSAPRRWSDVLRVIELIRGFDSPVASDRHRLALSLGSGDGRDAAVLIEALMREPEPNAAGAVIWSLARIGDAAVPALVEHLGAEESQRRHRALEALMKIGTDRSLTAVAAQTAHGDARVRAHANIVAGTRGDVGVVAALVAQVAAGEFDMESSDALATLTRRSEITVEVARATTAAIAESDAEIAAEHRRIEAWRTTCSPPSE